MTSKVAPEDIVNPPSVPHKLIVAGGIGGHRCTCKHPLIITPAKASIVTILRILISYSWKIIFLRSTFARVITTAEFH